MKRTTSRATPEARAADPVGVAWRLLGSSRTAALLLVITASSVLAGALLPQLPRPARMDPVAHAVWIEERRRAFGRAVGLLDTLSLFAVYNSWWFRLLLCALALCCSVYVAARLEPWCRRVRPAPSPGGIDPEATPAVARFASRHPPAIAAGQVTEALRSAGYTVTSTETTGTMHIRAERNRHQRHASVAAHLGFVVLLGAAAVGHVVGWQEPAVAVVEGSTVEIGHSTGLAVRNDGFTHTRYPGGEVPKDYVTEITLLKDGLPVRQGYQLRVNSPLSYRGVRVHQAFYGPAVGMRVAGADGRPLLTGGIPLLRRDPENRSAGRARAGGYELEVLAPRTDEPDRAVPRDAVRVRVYRAGSGTGLSLAEVDAPLGQPVAAAGLTLLFEGPRQYSGLHVTKNPAVVYVWGGAVLALAGTLYVFALPYRATRLIVYPVGGGTGVTLRHLSGRPMGREQETARVLGAVRTAIMPEIQGAPHEHDALARKP